MPLLSSRPPEPTFLIIGRNGQVGWELCRTLGPLGKVVAIDFPEIDLTQPESIRRWVREVNPRVIVNAAAYTAVDKAETDEAQATLINGVAPGILAEEARERRALLIHYSTDYVFDGRKSLAYVEDDAPHPLGAYGRSKLAGDQAVAQTGCAHLTFRLCWVYGARGQNFFLTIRRLAREREQLRIVCDQMGCPTWARLIAEATAHAARQTLAAEDAEATRYYGIYHLAASGSTTWHGFAEAIVHQMPEADRRCREVVPIPTADYPTPAKRPAYSVLDCTKLQRTFGLKLPEWRPQLALVQEL
jgi:dTDP-4-dehydrorhamnose reductase